VNVRWPTSSLEKKKKKKKNLNAVSVNWFIIQTKNSVKSKNSVDLDNVLPIRKCISRESGVKSPFDLMVE